MSEKSEQTKKKLLKNADKITIAVLALILLGMGYAWWQEQNSAVATAEATAKPATFTDELAGSPTVAMLQSMSPNPDIQKNPDALRVAQLSMFDLNTMGEEQRQETQARTLVAQAKTLIDQGKPDEARPLLKQALDVARYDKLAVQLMDKITTKTETTGAAGQPGMPEGLPAQP